MTRENTVSVPLRLPRDVHDRMTREADRRMVGTSYLYIKAIELLLDNLPPLEPRTTEPEDFGPELDQDKGASA